MRLLLFLVAFSCAAAGLLAQGGSAPLLGLLPGGRWAPEMLRGAHFVPALEEREQALVIASPPGEESFAYLQVGLFAGGFRLSTALREAGGGRLVVAFGADPDRTRGFELELGSPTVLRELRPDGARELARTARPRGDPETRLELVVGAGRVKVRWGEEDLGGRKGLALPARLKEGRIHLGARGGAVRLAHPAIEGLLSGRSTRRIRRAATLELPPLPSPPPVPLLGPVDLVADADLVSGLPEAAGRVLLTLRDRALAGGDDEVLAAIEALARDHLAAGGPAFLAGALRLLRHADPHGARRYLLRAVEFSGAPGLLGDAHWLLGDLERARSFYEKGEEGGGLALVAWARGDREDALRLAAAAPTGGCRRAGQRRRLVLDLGLLQGWKPLARATGRGVSVLTDTDRATARRLARAAAPFLQGAEGFLASCGVRGPRRPRPLTILLCGTTEVFHLWNDRIGGARFEEADGIYRPGCNLLLLLQDDDPGVTARRLRHELVHHLVFESGWVLPRALEEGLAECLASGTPRRRSLVAVGGLAPGRFRRALQLARDENLERPSTVLVRERLGGGDRGRDAYAQAWAAVHALLTREPADLGRLVDLVQTAPSAEITAFLDARLPLATLRSHLEQLASTTR